MGITIRKLILLIGDAVLLYTALFLMLQIRYWGDVDASLFWSHAIPFSAIYVIWLAIFYVLDFYDLTSSLFDATFLGRLLVAITSFFVSGVIFFYLFSFLTITPKTNLLIDILIFGALATLWRFLFLQVVLRFAPLRISIYGTNHGMDDLQKSIESHQSYGLIALPTMVENADLANAISSQKLHAIVFPKHFFTDPVAANSLYQCLNLGVRFFDPAQAYELFVRRIPLASIGHAWFIRNIHEREQSLYLVSKRVFDFCISIVFLLITFPLWLLIMVMIKFEDVHGDIFYTQKRVGKSGQIFDIIKFRTMRQNAEQAGAQWAQKHDPRVTRVGRLLRRTHLDELPQIINVLKSNLSLVGPRPERPEFVEKLAQEVPHYHIRHFIQPGVTGWAQIRFPYVRSVSDSRTKFEYDLYYIKNRSLAFDVLILLKTIQFVFRNSE